jgi:hypothetical protein
MSEHAYQVTVSREDGQWLADVPELQGAHTYARSLPTLDQSAALLGISPQRVSQLTAGTG